eukprot:2803054-Prorocentrum_lima.AAC.1
MTSSLVGSEMCIRDRRDLVRFGERLGPASAKASSLGGRGEESGAPSSGTVSYTHLTLPTICSV